MSDSRCPRCGVPREVMLRGLTDNDGHWPGQFAVAHCPPCDVWWIIGADGRTAPELAGPDYYTHGPAWDVFDGASTLRRKLKMEVLRRSFGYDLAAAPQAGVRALGAALAGVPAIRRRIGMNNVRLVSGPPRRLLDVGCGNGSFMLSMRRLGWQVEGIEPDPAAARHALDRALAVRIAALESCELEHGRYDAIIAHHVLEHLKDPWDAMQRLALALRTRGRLIVFVPNPASAGARRFGPAWQPWEAPRHRVLLGPRGLLAAARGAGLRSRVTSTWRVTWPTAFFSLRLGEGAAPSRARVAAEVALLRLRFGRLRGEELVLEATRP